MTASRPAWLRDLRLNGALAPLEAPLLAQALQNWGEENPSTIERRLFAGRPCVFRFPSDSPAPNKFVNLNETLARFSLSWSLHARPRVNPRRVGALWVTEHGAPSTSYETVNGQPEFNSAQKSDRAAMMTFWKWWRPEPGQRPIVRAARTAHDLLRFAQEAGPNDPQIAACLARHAAR